MLTYSAYLILGQTKERAVLMDVGFVRLTDWNWIIYSSPKEHLEMELVWLGWYNACLNSEGIHLGKLIDLFGIFT